MTFVEITCTVYPIEMTEIVIAELLEAGFESFSENENSFSAYIRANDFNEQDFRKLSFFSNPHIKEIQYSIKYIEDQNWNTLWEKNFEPVLIDDECYIRAPFHPEKHDVKFQILIEPKMSFGTGHHATTQMMVQLILRIDLNNKKVLDMGCGTGILAILAKKAGAGKVTAIDNDEWAYRNTIENINRNGCSDIEVLLGDASLLNDCCFDIIFANINRNILLQDMPYYSDCLQANGILLLSGFYINDLETICHTAEQLNLKILRYNTLLDWCAAQFQKF